MAKRVDLAKVIDHSSNWPIMAYPIPKHSASVIGKEPYERLPYKSMRRWTYVDRSLMGVGANSFDRGSPSRLGDTR